MDDVPRPEPPASLSSRAQEWVEWLGVGRLVTSAIATVIVCLGGWWLVRTPPAPSEAALPRTTGLVAASTPEATLPPPSIDVSTTELPTTDGVNAAATSAIVVVHVAGAVEQPGVYEIAANERVASAIDLAGGAAEVADPDALNLAAPLADGMRIYVPMVGEDVTTPLVSGPTGSAPPSGQDSGATPIDVNRASAGELEALPGVGPATATAIVTERERNGPFVSVDDLERVPGIGPAKLAALRDRATT